MKKNIIIGLLILVPIILTPVVYFQHDRIETLFSPQTADGNSLIQRDGLYYQKFTEEPFTGEVTGKQRGKIVKGIREGTWVSYWDNGQLDYRGNYKNDKKEGTWVSYWDNGQLWDKGNIKNGKKEGRWVFYDSGGTKRITADTYGWDEGSGVYRNGKKVSD